MKIDENDRGELTALAEAIRYADAAGAKHDQSLSKVRERVRRLDIMMQLGGPDLHRFVGRKSDLAELSRMWDEGESFVSIEGPGGIGKSLLVCRFVSDLLQRENGKMAVFHFEFDRRDLQIFKGKYRSASRALARELIRQARDWLPAIEIDELLENKKSMRGTSVWRRALSRARPSPQFRRPI